MESFLNWRLRNTPSVFRIPCRLPADCQIGSLAFVDLGDVGLGDITGIDEVKDRQEADGRAGSTPREEIKYDTRLHTLIDDYKDEEDKLTFLKRVGTMLSV